MSRLVLTLELPEDVSERVRRAAKGMKQPLEKALVHIVRAATPSLDKVPLEHRAALEKMEDLSDDELRSIAESTLTPAKQRRLEKLLDKNQGAGLLPKERAVLTTLRREADRQMLQRSYAYLLLKYRGQRVPHLADLKQP
jgi:hypothetical protein